MNDGSLLRGVLRIGGTVATAAGLHSMVLGTRSLPGARTQDAVIDSELRYYAGFYSAFGLTALWLAPRAEQNLTAVRALAGTLFGSGLARAGSWLSVGSPHPLQRALLAIELGLPPFILALTRAQSA